MHPSTTQNTDDTFLADLKDACFRAVKPWGYIPHAEDNEMRPVSRTYDHRTGEGLLLRLWGEPLNFKYGPIDLSVRLSRRAKTKAWVVTPQTQQPSVFLTEVDVSLTQELCYVHLGRVGTSTGAAIVFNHGKHTVSPRDLTLGTVERLLRGDHITLISYDAVRRVEVEYRVSSK